MSERTIERVKARRGEPETLTASEIAEREEEKAELLARLDAQERASVPDEPVADEPDDDVPMGTFDPEALALGERLIHHAAVAERVSQDADARLLADAHERLRPVRGLARAAVYEVRVLARDHATTIDVLRDLDWKYLHDMLVATIHHRRVSETHGAVGAVLDSLRNVEETWQRLRGEIKSLSVVKLATDRNLVPRLEQELRWLAECPYSVRQDFYRLRDAVTRLDQALKAVDGERVPASADARATAATASENRVMARSENPSLPVRPDDVKSFPGRVKDRNPFDV